METSFCRCWGIKFCIKKNEKRRQSCCDQQKINKNYNYYISFVSSFSDLSQIGSQVVYAGATRLPYGQIPVLLYNGEVTLQTPGGKMATLILATYSMVFSENPANMEPNDVCFSFMSRLCIFQFCNQMIYVSGL